MKVYYLISILLVVVCTTFAKNIVNKRNRVNSKSKRAETSNKCKYIYKQYDKKNMNLIFSVNIMKPTMWDVLFYMEKLYVKMAI